MKNLLLLILFLIPAHLVHAEKPASIGTQIVAAARSQIGITLEYNPSYKTLGYPNGDIPIQTGVCSDVVIRALRKTGLDLQQAVHEDMLTSFKAYPQNWGLKKPDKNIDHRRVPNLMCYFKRKHIHMSENLTDPMTYSPGDIVAWNLGNGILHIGIVSDKVTGKSKIPLIIHNIGNGAQEEAILFKYQVIGHYRIRESSLPVVS